MGIIYCYTNLINNKKYIGQTINPKQRKNAHKCYAFIDGDGSYNTPFHRAIRKYGWENFKYEILAESSKIEDLNDLEIFYIQKYNSIIPNGYNILSGGKNSLRGPMSDDTKYLLTWPRAKLSEEEVIFLREAYARKESPKKIYDENYKDKLHYQSFLNIWSGRRYKNIRPDLIEKGRHTKISYEDAENIRKLYNENNTTYQQLAEQYNVTKQCIASIIKYKTHKSPKK